MVDAHFIPENRNAGQLRRSGVGRFFQDTTIETSKFTLAKLRTEAAKQQTPNPSSGPD